MAIAEDKKTERLVARVSAEDKELIERAAELEGRSLSSFTVEHLLACAREVIEEQESLRLNEAESRRLVQLLNDPPRQPSPEFSAALAQYRSTVISDVNHSESSK